MHKYITGPLIIGILVFLLVMFIIPLVISASVIVSAVANSALSISNILFEVMPPLIVDFIGNLNLPLAALSLGLTISVAFQSVALLQEVLAYLFRLIRQLVEKRTQHEVEDLPPIEMDIKYQQSKKDRILYGKGLDSIDHD